MHRPLALAFAALLTIASPAMAGPFTDYLVAHVAATSSDPATAADRFLDVLHADPDDLAIRQQAFVNCLLAGRPEALNLAQGLAANPGAQLLLGDFEARGGNWDAAADRFAALPMEGVTQVLQPLLLAWAQYGPGPGQGGHPDTGLATLQPLLDGPRYRGIYALHAAMMADLAGRDAEAERLYGIADASFPKINLRLAQLMASYQARHGHMDNANTILDRLVADNPDMGIARRDLQANIDKPVFSSATDAMAEAYLAMAATLHQQDANEFAQLLLRLAIDMRPDFSAARLLASDLEDADGRTDQAQETLAAISPDDPLITLAQLRIASLRARRGDTDGAAAILEAMANDHPTAKEPLLQLGDMLRAGGKFDDAAHAYDRAIQRIGTPGPSDWGVFYARGIALDRAHHWEAAESDFDEALKLSPDQPYVLNYLAFSWTEQGRNLAQAHDMLETAARARPNDGSIIDSLGWVLLRQGDIKGGVHWLERACELLPEDATINAHLGDAYLAAGRLREAEDQWRLSLVLHPEPEDVPKLEAKLHEAAAKPQADTKTP